MQLTYTPENNCDVVQSRHDVCFVDLGRVGLQQMRF